MFRSALLISLFLPAIASAATAPCGTPASPPLPDTVPAPEMYRSPPALAACVNVTDFVARARQPAARQVATREPARPAAAPAAAPAYQPKTEHDNSPWRFDMSQNGRRMTADEFDAWMKAKGIRVATGKPGAATATAAPAAVPVAAGCKVTATEKC